MGLAQKSKDPTGFIVIRRKIFQHLDGLVALVLGQGLIAKTHLSQQLHKSIDRLFLDD